MGLIPPCTPTSPVQVDQRKQNNNRALEPSAMGWVALPPTHTNRNYAHSRRQGIRQRRVAATQPFTSGRSVAEHTPCLSPFSTNRSKPVRTYADKRPGVQARVSHPLSSAHPNIPGMQSEDISTRTMPRDAPYHALVLLYPPPPPPYPPPPYPPPPYPPPPPPYPPPP